MPLPGTPYSDLAAANTSISPPWWMYGINPALASIHPKTRTVQDTILAAIQAIPESIRNRISPFLGRIVTNLISPNDPKMAMEDLQNAIQYPLSSLKSVIKDEPVYKNSPENMMVNPLWRRYWNMNPRDDSHYFNIQDKNFAFNPANEQASGAIASIRASQPEYTIGHYIPGQPDKWNFDLHPEEVPMTGQPYRPDLMLRQIAESFTGQNAPSVQTSYP